MIPPSVVAPMGDAPMGHLARPAPAARTPWRLHARARGVREKKSSAD